MRDIQKKEWIFMQIKCAKKRTKVDFKEYRDNKRNNPNLSGIGDYNDAKFSELYYIFAIRNVLLDRGFIDKDGKVKSDKK